MSVKWYHEQRDISELQINQANPRKLGKRQGKELKSSLEKFGTCQPIVCNLDGFVVGGHQRLALLRSMGHKRMDVCVPDRLLTAEEVDELAIRLNKNVGEWDIDILANSWDLEKLCEWGFSMEELHLESIPDQKEDPKKFDINISCIDQDQLELIEKHIADVVNDFSGAKYKVKVK